MLVELKQQGLLSISILGPNGIETGQVILLPGVNKVSDEDWEKVRGQVKKDKIDRGIIIEHHAEIKEVEEPVKDEKTGEETIVKKTKVKSKKLKDLSAVEAIKIIKETYDLKTLKDWKNKGGLSKDAVIAELISQIRLVESHGEDKKSVDMNKED